MGRQYKPSFAHGCQTAVTHVDADDVGVQAMTCPGGQMKPQILLVLFFGEFRRVWLIQK